MKLKILSFDCEVLPLNKQMPDPLLCPIMLISFTANYEIMNKKKKVIFVLNRNKNNPENIIIRDIENDVVVRFNDERRMIKGWEKLLKLSDIITGYNISGFDIPYIVDRAKALNVGVLKIGNGDDILSIKSHLSKGRNVTKINGIKGKILQDILYILRRDDASNTIKTDYHLKNLKLEVTAKEILGKNKKDFSIEEMIEYWKNGTNEDKFINYCSVDSELALEFITKFRLLDKFIGLSRRSGKVTQDIIDSQGFGGLVENLLQKDFMKLDRVVPNRTNKYKNDDSEDELGGAFVLEPKKGISDHVIISDYACCIGDTLILTDKGLIKIKNIENLNNDIVLVNSFNKGEFTNKKVIDFKNMGIENTKKITLENGYELEGSTSHRILTVNNGCPVYSEMKDLKINDIVILNKGSNIYGDDVIFNYYKDELLDTIKEGQYGSYKNIFLKKVYEGLSLSINLPSKVTPEFAEFFGYMISDGFVKNSTLGFTQKDTEVFERFIYLYDTVFKRKDTGKNKSLLDYCEGLIIENNTDHIENNTESDVVKKLKNNQKSDFELRYRYKGGHDVSISSINLVRLFKYYGFSGNSYEKEVPWCILQSSKECQCSFLMTLFEGDGCANKLNYNTKFNNRRIHYISKSKKLCHQIQTMLLNMGIISNLYHSKCSNDYIIYLTGYNCVLYYENIGFVSERKISKNKSIVNSVMGYDYTDNNKNNNIKIDFDKISKKDKIGNYIPKELHVNKVLKNLHSKYISMNYTQRYYNNTFYDDDPSFFRSIYRYINNDDNINIVMLKKYLKIVEPRLSHDIDYKKLKWLSECKMIFLKIQKIEDCKNNIYDISVDDTHNYISNGFISHNSLYPSLMMRYNICYTTLITDNSIPDNENTMHIIRNGDDILLGRFIKQNILKGVIPTILESLMTERKIAKSEMKKYEKGSAGYLMYDSEQNATKILMNSFYGYSGEQGAKLYHYSVAASVTGSGQKQIKYTMKMIDGIIVTDIDDKKYKLEIIMSDTDSIYVQVIPLQNITKELNTITELNREICVRVVSKELDKINETLEKPMKIAFEDYAKRVLITAKKRYTKIIVDENGKESVKSKGIETQRRDWCNFSTESLEKAIEIILYEKDVTIGTKKMISFIKNEAEKLRNGKIEIEKLMLSKTLTKPITSYDNKAIHVQVAIKMKERGRPSQVGDRIQFIIINNGKSLITEKAEEADYVIKGESKDKIDYDYYVTKQLYPPIERMLEVIGSNKELLYIDKKQKSLMDF